MKIRQTQREIRNAVDKSGLACGVCAMSARNGETKKKTAGEAKAKKAEETQNV